MRGSTINGCQAGTCASVNVLMDHCVLFPLFLAHFLSSLLFASFCVSQAVLFTCLSLSCSRMCASLSPLFFAACSGWQRVLALIDSSWRQSLVTCAPRLSHVAASVRGKDSVAIFQVLIGCRHTDPSRQTRCFRLGAACEGEHWQTCAAST